MPYWNAPAYYGAWAGGCFNPFNPLLPGLLLGSTLGANVYTMDAYGDFAEPGEENTEACNQADSAQL